MTPTTEAGRALAERLNWKSGETLGPIADILAIEAEAIAAERERIRTAATAVAWLQDAYIIEAMNGERRHPRTPADWVEAYRAAVLAIIDGEATDD